MLKSLLQAEWTGFQEVNSYSPDYDLRCDFVMAYGIDQSLPERIAAWRKRGYTVHLMTGIAWGQYQDYLEGAFDGRNHWDEAQTSSDGQPLLHCETPDVPYMVPAISFCQYLLEGLKKAIDCGVEAVFLEEPEFWMDGGYSPAFQREWQIYYGDAWTPQHSSAEAQYRTSKLKAYLYRRAIDRLCSELKDYAAVKYNRRLRCYVPTHSLINYAQWRCVSPESQLLEIPACDGYIGQVWTGTARTPNVYAGVRAERTFETAFLEYGILQELVRGTGREMWFLHDPIEDDPSHTWSDYRSNYFCTVAASLLHPGVNKYEICPWPQRIFKGEHPSEDGQGKETIPPAYATEILTVMNILRDIHNHPGGSPSGTQGIGILLADSAMYQRPLKDGIQDAGVVGNSQTQATERITSERSQELLDWSSFYGLALPLVKHGIPLRPVQLENILRYPGYLDEYRVLLLSYEFMKPEHPAIHQALSSWVHEGGILLYFGDDSDPFHGVREWWNQDSCRYTTPAAHLFSCLGLGETSVEGDYHCGKGNVIIRRVNPEHLANSTDGGETVRDLLRLALRLLGVDENLTENNYFQIRRGPYLITVTLNESCSKEPVLLQGSFVDLLQSTLPVCNTKELHPGEQSLLYDLAYDSKKQAQVVASSSLIKEEQATPTGLTFISEAPQGITVTTRIILPEECREVEIESDTKLEQERDAQSHTIMLQYPGEPEGVSIRLRW